MLTSKNTVVKLLPERDFWFRETFGSSRARNSLVKVLESQVWMLASLTAIKQKVDPLRYFVALFELY